jgi:hypothetical protein
VLLGGGQRLLDHVGLLSRLELLDQLGVVGLLSGSWVHGAI